VSAKQQVSLHPTCKRDDTEDPGESGGKSGGPDVSDIFFYLKTSSKIINELNVNILVSSIVNDIIFALLSKEKYGIIDETCQLVLKSTVRTNI
jgi:hypothetical protein